jgi:hypothetical protein
MRFLQQINFKSRSFQIPIRLTKLSQKHLNAFLTEDSCPIRLVKLFQVISSIKVFENIKQIIQVVHGDIN